MRLPGIIGLLFALLLTSCNSHFGPATWGQDQFTGAKPIYSGRDTAWRRAAEPMEPWVAGSGFSEEIL